MVDIIIIMILIFGFLIGFKERFYPAIISSY